MYFYAVQRVPIREAGAIRTFSGGWLQDNFGKGAAAWGVGRFLYAARRHATPPEATPVRVNTDAAPQPCLQAASVLAAARCPFVSLGRYWRGIGKNEFVVDRIGEIHKPFHPHILIDFEFVWIGWLTRPIGDEVVPVAWQAGRPPDWTLTFRKETSMIKRVLAMASLACCCWQSTGLRCGWFVDSPTSRPCSGRNWRSMAPGTRTAIGGTDLPGSAVSAQQEPECRCGDQPAAATADDAGCSAVACRRGS